MVSAGHSCVNQDTISKRKSEGKRTDAGRWWLAKLVNAWAPAAKLEFKLQLAGTSRRRHDTLKRELQHLCPPHSSAPVSCSIGRSPVRVDSRQNVTEGG